MRSKTRSSSTWEWGDELLTVAFAALVQEQMFPRSACGARASAGPGLAGSVPINAFVPAMKHRNVFTTLPFLNRPNPCAA